MDYQVMNQTLALAKEAIEEFLAVFPDDHPYQMAMSLPNFRQTVEAEIVSKVLKRRMRLIPEDSLEPFSPQLSIKLLEERLFIEDEIRLMMPNIVQNTHQDEMAVNPAQTSYYLITNLQDMIQSSSFNVCQLLNLKQKDIIGKCLLFFVPQWQWKKFYYYLDKMKKNSSKKELTEVWSMQLETCQPHILTRKLIDVEIETTVQRDGQGKMIGLHWLLHDLNQQPITPQHNYPTQHNYQDVPAINWATC